MNDIGCGDSGCIFNLIKKKGGQHTNGGCHCFKDLVKWLPEENRWNHEEVSKVQRDVSKLAQQLKQAKKQIEIVKKRCNDRLEYGESDFEIASEILQAINEVE